MKRDWNLTEEDFKNAQILYEEEKIYPINEETMFRAGLYCILSAAEKYSKSRFVYQMFHMHMLDTPSRIISNREKMKELVKKLRFPNMKEKHVYKFALWWPKTSIPSKIIEDIKHGRKNEFNLRNRLAEEAPGMSYKSSSLFMIKCGYENVVPIDLWMLRFLSHIGYEVEIPDYKTRSGPKKKEYLEYEKLISEIARSYNVSPALFQFAVWSKHSTWNRKRI